MRKISTIHHLPATGGTIFSKAIAAMQNVVMVSEIHPFELADRRSLLHQLKRGYFPNMVEEQYSQLSELFVQRINFCLDMIGPEKHFIIRDHVHADFLLTGRYDSTLRKIAETNFDLMSIATIRDPIETWLSHVERRWTKLEPNEFCENYLDFCNRFNEDQIFKYEDFVDEPNKILQAICEKLGIEFSNDFAKDVAEFAHFTGASGRSDAVIKQRPLKPITKANAYKFRESKAFQEMCERFGYCEREPDFFENFASLWNKVKTKS